MPLDQNNEHVVPIGGNLVELPVDDGAAVPAGTRALLTAGVDGAGDARALSIDTATGALNVAVITATISAIGSTGAAVPTTAIQVGASDGTNLQAPRVFDIDSGAGTQYVLGTNLRRSAAGGSTELLAQATMALSIPVVIASNQSAVPVTDGQTSGTLNNGAQVTVDATVGGVQVLAADATRKAAIVQNTGSTNIRVGATGITNTTGFRLTAGAIATFSAPFPVTSAIFAIREGGSNSTALGQGIT